jgi:hypothetical protein
MPVAASGWSKDLDSDRDFEGVNPMAHSVRERASVFEDLQPLSPSREGFEEAPSRRIAFK